MRVLALLSDRPLPAFSGPSVRFAHLWPKVARIGGVELKVLALDVRDLAKFGPATWPGMDVEFFRYGPRPFLTRVVGVVSRSWHEYPFSPALARRVDELDASWRPDVIQADDLRMSAYLPGLRGRATSALQGVTFHNVESELFLQTVSPAVPAPLRPIARRLQIASLRRFEARTVASADLRLAYSELDCNRYAALYPGASFAATRNGADVEGIRPAPQARTPSIFLLGSWGYGPNRSGLRWMIDRVRPHHDPAIPVVVAGSGADATVRGWLAETGWTFHDAPVDLRPLYEAATVLAVPVLEGSGTRTKILESLAYERAVVTTTKGAEGLDFGEEQGVTIADDAEAFARRLVEVASSSPEVRAEATRRGRAAVHDRYDWSVVARELVDVWKSSRPG